MKCINKKNFAKSQSLLGKEIKILKVMDFCFVSKILPDVVFDSLLICL